MNITLRRSQEKRYDISILSTPTCTAMQLMTQDDEKSKFIARFIIASITGTRWRNQLGRQVLKPVVLGSIHTEDEPLTTIRRHNPNS